MIFYPLSALINAIASTIVCIIAIVKNRKVALNRSFSYFAFSVAFWAYSYFFWQISKDTQSALFWCRALMAGAIFIPATFFHFSICIIDQRKKYLKSIIFWYLVSLVFILLDFTPLFVKDIRPRLFFPFWPTAGIAYAPFLAMFAGLTIYAHILMFKSYRKLSGLKRNQIKYVFLGTAIGFVGGSTNYFLWYDIPIPPVGNILVTVYVLLVAYAIRRYQLMDIRIFISRAAAFILTYPLFLGFPFFFGYRLRPELESVLGRNWWLVPSGLLAIVAVIAPFIYGQLRKRMEEALLAEQKRYQKLLLQAARGMATEHDLNRLAKLIAYIVKRAVRIEFAAVFIEDKKTGTYELKAIRNASKSSHEHVTFLYEHPFIKYLRKHEQPFHFEELPSDLRNSLGSFSHTSLIIPSHIEDNILGFVLLGEKLNCQPYADDDINVFRILSHQAALAIENCLFMDETKQAQERIFAAEKLASIGGMADGVAHQIKNRLNQFSVASGELKYEIKDFVTKHPELFKKTKDLKKTFDYLGEIAESMLKNVKRTDGVVKGILNFAPVEETEKFFSQFSLKEAIDLSTELLQIKHELARIPLKIDLGSSDLIYGVKSQMTEAMYNLLDNAFEATQEKTELLKKEKNNDYEPLIKIKLTQKSKSHLIEISDNGVGMKDEDKRKIFAPFFTTKSSYKSGTGIGMYVVKRMVEENHKGKIWFTSTYGEGVKFSLELPKK